ncbi:MAG: hypothetical protein CTY15_04200 [Methylocystis sp.]|nr:MAG: hypothetical protein CTY15_04200 [Methylocystis sp.]
MKMIDWAARLSILLPEIEQLAPSLAASPEITRDFMAALTQTSKDRRGGAQQDADAPPADPESSQQATPVTVCIFPLAKASQQPANEAPASKPGFMLPATGIAHVHLDQKDNAASENPVELAVTGARLRMATEVASPAVQVAGEREAAPEVVHVKSLETYLPAAITHALAPSISSHTQAEEIARVRSEAPQNRAPVKILHLQIEPEALGALTIRMRMTRNQVEIEIDAQTPATAALLGEARDKLADALNQQGLALDCDDIRISQTQPSQPMSDERGSGASDEPRNSFGGRGATHEERSGRRNQGGAAPGDPPRCEVRAPSPSAGVFL